MFHVLIVGGGLQGVEAVYLAHKAGWQVTLVDRNVNCPASGMCDSFIHADVTNKDSLPLPMNNVDFIIPAFEDDEALAILESWAQRYVVPIAFDKAAYAISSSKFRSGRLFSHLNIPIPKTWPMASFPMIAKPSKSSGSRGIKILTLPDDMDRAILNLIAAERLILQEFLKGRSYSLEIMGCSGTYIPLQVTELFVDEVFDCKCVIAPADLPITFIDQFNELAINIASSLALTGIMDVEVILNEGELKVLEIDARLPSQTPTAVYWSSGVNMLCLLQNIFLSNKLIDIPSLQNVRGVVYQHVHVKPGVLEVAGEHLMSHMGPLHIEPDFWGADDVITNYHDGAKEWVATLVICDTNRQSALAKKDAILANIREEFKLDRYSDRTHYLLN
ncbi:MAG: 3-methylornithine--L-lysine ligase PylC [Deltaproteobacteria bacterium]|nr:3-methylornithine--L-lysine ligase PylC [Deltaproteobacteria bacterium]